MKKTLMVSAAGLALVGAMVAASPAMADPATSPRPVNGVGSDTTDPLMQALSGPITTLANWSVTGGAYDTNGPGNGVDGIDQPINTLANDDCEFETRVLGSGNGATAVANDFASNASRCYQFARSSALTTTRNTANNGHNDPAVTGTAVAFTAFPLGQDGLAYAFRINGAIIANYTLADLRSIYNCDDPSIGAFIPQNGSGTRVDWLALMNPAYAGRDVATDTTTTPPPSCIDDGPGTTTATEYREHNGAILTGGNQIVPHSVGQWIAQGAGDPSLPDNRGFARLGYVNGITPIQQYVNSPTLLSAGGANGAEFRTVYNLVPTANASQASITAIFGPTGSICANDATIIRAGFVPVC